MAKQNKLREELEARSTQGAVDNTTTSKASSKKDKTKQDNGFVRFFKKIGKAFKEMFSELKKVTWPTMKETGISLVTVLAVVLFFLLIVMGFDSLWTWLLQLLVQS